MHPPQQVVGGGGEHNGGVQLAPVGAHPALPEAAEPEGLAAAEPEQPGLLPGFTGGGIGAGLPLIETVSRQQGATMAPGSPEEGLLGHRLAAGIDRPAQAAGIAAPARHQAPEGQTHRDPAVLLPLQQQRLTGTHLGPGGVVLDQALRQRTLQPRQQPIEGGGEGVTAAHGPGEGVRFSRPPRGRTTEARA